MMATVWRSRWLDWQPEDGLTKLTEDDFIGSAPAQPGNEIISAYRENELTKLTKTASVPTKGNSVSFVSPIPGEAQIISIPEHDQNSIVSLPFKAELTKLTKTIWPTAPVIKDSTTEADATRPPMSPGVRLLNYKPKPAPVRLSRCELVSDSEKFIRVTLDQLSARLRGKSWQAGNWSLAELISRLQLVGCYVVLQDDAVPNAKGEQR